MTSLDPKQIAAIMGGDATGRDSVNVPGPNHSAGDRSLSIKINARAPGGFVVFSHAGDDPILCRDYVRERLGLGSFKDDPERTPFVVAVAGSDREKTQRTEFAMKIWEQSTDPRGTIVEHYLRQYRGLTIPDEMAVTVVRYHAHLRYGDGRFGGMVCLLRNIKTNEPTGIHRTFLDGEGRKIDRRMLGVAKGAAIKLDPDKSIVNKLTIGEGFETTLAGRTAGFGPAWALGSAGAIGQFPVLSSVLELTVLAENDATSQRSTNSVARRYLGKKRPVNVVTSLVGTDINDAWLEAQRK